MKVKPGANRKEEEQMTQVKSIEQNQEQTINRPQVTTLRALAVCLAISVAAAATSKAMNLKSGDIVMADSSSAVLRVDPKTGAATVISSGGNLVRPFGVVVEADSNILVADSGALAIIRIDSQTGSNRVVSSGGVLGTPYGITLDHQGNILVANAQAVVRVDPQSGAQTVVSANGMFRAPVGVAVAGDGGIFVADMTGTIVRVDPASGTQTNISAGTYLVNPVGITIDDDGSLLVADEGSHALVRLDAASGAQQVVSVGNDLVTPVSVVIGAQHDVLVGDPDAFSLNGAVIQIDPASDTQTNVYMGSGELVNPRGIALVPTVRGRIDQLCPCQGPSSGTMWKNHGKYVGAVSKVARQFVKSGSITKDEQRTIIHEALLSQCGR